MNSTNQENDSDQAILVYIYDTLGLTPDTIVKLERSAGLIDIQGIIYVEDEEIEEIVRKIDVLPIDRVKLRHFRRWVDKCQEEILLDLPQDLGQWESNFTKRSLAATPRSKKRAVSRSTASHGVSERPTSILRPEFHSFCVAFSSLFSRLGLS